MDIALRNIELRKTAQSSLELAQKMNRARARVFTPAYASANLVTPTGPVTGDINPANLSNRINTYRDRGLILDVRKYAEYRRATDRNKFLGMERRRQVAIAGGITGLGIGTSLVAGPTVPLIVAGGYAGLRHIQRRREYIYERYGTLGNQIAPAGLNPLAHIGNTYRSVNYLLSHAIPLTTDLDWRNIGNATRPGLNSLTTLFNISKNIFMDLENGNGFLGKLMVRFADGDKDFKSAPWAKFVTSNLDKLTKFIKPARPPKAA